MQEHYEDRPLALNYADYLEGSHAIDWHIESAEELRRQHKEIEALKEQVATGKRLLREEMARANRYAQRVPLDADTVQTIMLGAGYSVWDMKARADFINGIRHGEDAHGFTQGYGDGDAQRVPLSDEQLSKALEDGGVGTQTHTGITNRVSWTTCGSIDPRKICRAIEAAHGITQRRGDGDAK